MRIYRLSCALNEQQQQQINYPFKVSNICRTEQSRTKNIMNSVCTRALIHQVNEMHCHFDINLIGNNHLNGWDVCTFWFVLGQWLWMMLIEIDFSLFRNKNQSAAKRNASAFMFLKLTDWDWNVNNKWQCEWTIIRTTRLISKSN